MKLTKTIVSVNQPCAENWDAMQAAANGRFCNLCQKTVTDFTHLSDTEINRLTRHANGAVCGRFLKTQVNRPLAINEPSTFSFGKIFMGISLAAIFNNNLFAFTKQTPAFYQTENKKASNYTFLAGDSLRVLKVKLMDSATKEPIAFANVVATATVPLILVTTNIDGIAELKIPDSYKKNIIEIKGVYIGYTSKTINVDISKTNYIEMYLNDSGGTTLTTVGLVFYEKQTFWTRVKNKFKRKQKAN